MAIIFKLLCFATVFVAQASASAAPDNFFMALDKDLLKLKGRKCKDVVEIQPTKVKHDIKPPEEFFDDYDLAEHEIFDRVENAEKIVLAATGNLIRDPVNFLFSNHKDNSDKMMGEEINQFSGRRGSHLFQKDKKKANTVSTKKESVVVVEPEEKHMRFKHLIEELKSRLTLNRKD